MQKIYDMIVIGGGPGGYTAALYGARAGLSVMVLEKLSAGGQMALTENIENYPGFEDGIDGFSLGEKMQQQAEKFGAETELAEVLSVKLDGEIKELETSEGPFFARTVVIATGAKAKKLGLPNEDALVGRGVNYCAACDGMRYKGKTVAIVGGGNSAVADALVLSRIAEKVILIHRRDTLRATKVYHKALESASNIEFRWNSIVTEFCRDEIFSGIKVRNVITAEMSTIACDGIFVSIGREPVSSLFENQLALDNGGYVLTDSLTRTSLPGVFAVGDVRNTPLRQVVTAVADGALAAQQAEEFLLN